LLPPNAQQARLHATDAGDDWLTVKEVADMLKVCTATVYKMVDRLRIPHIRVLNSIRFRRGHVKRFVEEDRSVE
jgi:excisionase family DNA binding protein